MPDNNTFALLREELLRAGIAPRRVRRLLRELQAHYELLLEEELSRGNTNPAAAHSAARERLGSDADILRKTLERPELRSWGARLPFMNALAPPLGLAASLPMLVGLFVALVAIANHFYSVRGAQGGFAGGGALLAMAIMPWLVLYGLPLVWAGMLAWYAASRRLRGYWSAAGLLLMAALGASTNCEIRWPSAAAPGQLSGGIGFSTQPAPLAHFGARCIVTCLLGVVLYVVLMRTRERPASAKA
jgi:hypothetical protein